jgi:hypothetical protein
VTEQTVYVISATTARERIAGLLATTRYWPKEDAGEKDKYGMPVVAPENYEERDSEWA